MKAAENRNDGPETHDLRFGTLVSRVAAGDEIAGAELYQQLMPIRRYFSMRLSDQESDDRFHDVFVAVWRAVRAGGLQDSERIMAYAWSTAKRIRGARISVFVVERSLAAEDDTEFLSDDSPDPESMAIHKENHDIARRVLAAMPARDREVLERYYLHAQPREVIQQEMGLTPTQFRLIKSKAKAALTARLQRRLTSAPRLPDFDPERNAD